jgi:hypothetical protein
LIVPESRNGREWENGLFKTEIEPALHGCYNEVEEAQQEKAMFGDRLIIEEVNDPAEVTRSKAQMERFRRNSEWLETHWADLLPQARGKHLAVAGQEAFLANTPEEAWAWVDAVHPEDDGAFVRYVFPDPGASP